MRLRHPGERFMQHNQAMRGGTGTITVSHFLNPDELHGKGRLFAENTVPPGASIGLHRHEGETEVYVILQGRARYRNNDDCYDISAGDVVQVDDQDLHGIENTGELPLVFIALILFTGAAK